MDETILKRKRRQSYQKGHISGPRSVTKCGVKVQVWDIRYYVKVDGKWKQKHETVIASTKTAAQKVLDDRLGNINGKVNPTLAKEITFRDFYSQNFVSFMKKNAKDASVDSWTSIAKNHLLPAFGDKYLSEIDKRFVIGFFNDNKKLISKSHKTQDNVYSCLNRILNLAEEQDYISNTPLVAKMKLRPKVQWKEKPTLSPLQLQMVLEALPLEHKAFYVTVGLTALRVGQALGLKWKDINWTEEKISSTRSIYKNKEQTPKTKYSMKLVNMPSQLREILQWHKQNISNFTKPDDFIFCNPATGRPWSQNEVRDYTLYPAYEKANQMLPPDEQIVRTPHAYGFHINRHTGGSIMLDETGDITKAGRLLGHGANSNVTDIYIHQIGNADVRASQQMADRIFPQLRLPENSSAGSITNALPNGTNDEAVEEQTLIEVS